MSVSVEIDMQQSSMNGRLVAAPFTVTIADKVFPQASYFDCPVVVLGWLATATRKILTAVSDRESVRFMDGPFILELARLNSNECRVTGLEDMTGHRKVVAQGQASPSALASDIVTKGEAVLRWCRDRGWLSSDSEYLEREIRDLRALIAPS